MASVGRVCDCHNIIQSFKFHDRETIDDTGHGLEFGHH